jgi:leader peptidase (prepilin peptidase)/N-methyltransferase
MVNIAEVGGAIALGLLVGSFLNVVIYRLPFMMEREWRLHARDVYGDDAGNTGPEEDTETFNLVTPRSRCPSCHTAIAPWHNIPVLSWLLLRGRCASCSTPISVRYPLIELATGLLSGLIVWEFGAGFESGMLLLLLWSLISLTMIDIDHTLLPDSITLPLLWLGLAFSLFHVTDSRFPGPADAIIGAIAGYLFLWSVYWLFKLVTGKEGMGYGDFKLLAALGAWLGWQTLPLVILLSALVGTIIGLGMIVLFRRDRQLEIPFGPYLAGAGLIALLWDNQLIDAWMRITGMLPAS